MNGIRTKLKTKKDDRGILHECAACGARSLRESAHYCPVCGKTLTEDYQPLDQLRSSYRLQGQGYLLENSKREVIQDLFAVNRNPISETAWASCVYSMVPYVGVVFIPFTIVSSFLGFGMSLRNPTAGGAKLSASSFFLSFVILALQIFLWWLLYIIPELGRTI